MKSLDEVMEAIERCSKPHCFECEGCPYEDAEADCGCHPEDRDADVLHYLKEYKASQEKPLLNRLTAVLREVRGEVK